MTSPNQKLNADELAGSYGFAAAFFNIDPELKRLLDQAVREQWTADKFKAKFMATNWYRNNEESARQYAELKARSPQEYNTRMDEQFIKLRAQASQMGITVDDGTLRKIAEESLLFSFPEQVIRERLAGLFKYKPGGGTTGQASAIEAQLKGLAGDYGVTVGDVQIADLVGGVLSGKWTTDNLQDFTRDMARSKYPGMRGYLDQGFTVRQVASPYTQSYAQILEVDPNSVDLTDSHIQKALQGTPDPKTGQAVMQSVYDFERTLRQDPRWQYTRNAHDQLTTVGQGILKDMGLYS